MSKDKKKATLKENVVSIILAIFLVMVIRSTFFEPYKIPSGSMVPTLLVGDHIFVKKFAYGWKVPFTEFFMEEPMYLGGKSLPERGDIIVFKYPRDPSIYYIKRVVGIPGDKIEVIDKKIYINGKPVETSELHSFFDDFHRL